MTEYTVREVICEAITDGLSPEVAANMLLEPSKWKAKLFDPTRDLATVYKQYLRGDLGVGVLSDSVNQVLAASNDMADLTDTIVRTYGQDATPGEIPERSEVGDIDVEDEQVEVLVRDSDNVFVSKIVEHVLKNWPVDIIEDLYGETLVEQVPGMPPPRRAGELAGPSSRMPRGSMTQMTRMIPPVAAQQPAKPQRRTRAFMPGERIRPETLAAFEQGKMLNNIQSTAQEILNARKQIAQLYQAQRWFDLANMYQPGGPLELGLGYLAGDIMVLKDIVDSAIRSGYGDQVIGGVEPIAAPVRTEAWAPALLDPEIGREIDSLLNVLHAVSRGDVTYAQLQQQIKPFVQPTSLLFRLAARGAKRSPAAAPFAADQAQAQKLARSAVTQAAAPEPEVEQPTQTAVDVLRSLEFDEPGGEEELPAPPEEAPMAQPPEVAAPAEEPNLADIFGDVIPSTERKPDSDRLQGLLMLKPNRAEQFVQFLKKSKLQPGIVVREIEDAYKALAELENLAVGDPVANYQKRFRRKMPIIAKAIGTQLRKMLDAGEAIQSGPLMAAGLAAQKS